MAPLPSDRLPARRVAVAGYPPTTCNGPDEGHSSAGWQTALNLRQQVLSAPFGKQSCSLPPVARQFLSLRRGYLDRNDGNVLMKNGTRLFAPNLKREHYNIQ